MPETVERGSEAPAHFMSTALRFLLPLLLKARAQVLFQRHPNV